MSVGAPTLASNVGWHFEVGWHSNVGQQRWSVFEFSTGHQGRSCFTIVLQVRSVLVVGRRRSGPSLSVVSVVLGGTSSTYNTPQGWERGTVSSEPRCEGGRGREGELT